MRYSEFKKAVAYLEERNGEFPSFGVLIDFLQRMN